MPPMPAATCGTRAPTAKNLVAAAMPIWPGVLSRAMIDQVIFLLKPSVLASGCVTLHAPRIGGGTAARAHFGCRRQPAFRPVGAGLDDMAAPVELIDGRLRHEVFDHEYAGQRGAGPERDREMFGVPCRRVDRLL